MLLGGQQGIFHQHRPGHGAHAAGDRGNGIHNGLYLGETGVARNAAQAALGIGLVGVPVDGNIDDHLAGPHVLLGQAAQHTGGRHQNVRIPGDLGGVDGLVHISELSWNKIKHPSEVVKEGDVLDVYIKDLNRETKKISLGFKKIEDNPWTIAQSKINVGDVVKCKIVRMMPFGAFAEIMPNVDGLIHISQIADRRIGKPEDVLTIGEEVEAKVTDLNWDEKKISLSIRALIPTPEKEEEVKEEEAPVEDHNAETLVYSTDPEVEVEEAIEVEADDAE